MTKKIASIIIGSIFLSIGVNIFLVPYHLLDGGVIGLGLIANYLTGVQAGLFIIFISIPIFTIAWVYKRAYFYNSMHGMLFSSFSIDFLSSTPFPYLTDEWLPPIASSIIGGILIGIGIGIMLRYQTSTGGTDLLAQLLATKINVNVGVLIFVVDAFVISLGGLLISFDAFLLSIVTILFVGIFTSLCTWKATYVDKNEL
ncbi:YitT family protein [Aquibacillus salsiterrae]|uniref:YitT family protein n=1 Tax=Aquibacillus salsiterrae TaxID=2950439 RepID=A0A9X3WFX1_9BACI|nr:YitT family protein [Aquibacillus salsiterrae]MDC3417696.1 YitT family protein [Aquibacillus salsiterrae]